MSPASDISSRDLLACAISAVKAAGAHAMANLQRRREAIKMLDHDIKLRLDIECQARAESAIRSAFPTHNILGEEDDVRKPRTDSPYEWIVDPIDGTVNFYHGLPLWCSSVACRKNDTVLAGAVFAPEMDRLYEAGSGGPALCNGEIIQVSETATLASAMIMTGQDRSLHPDTPPLSILTRIAVNSHKVRMMGSAALDVCQVAQGSSDGYFEAGVFIWDVAAAGLIVERAGGKAELTFRLEEGRIGFLATNGRIHEELKSLVLAAHQGRG